MGIPAAGAVVLVRFPFSDLSSSKLRPALVLADAGREDWILCQITSNPYSDPRAVELTEQDFQEGSLRVVSYARPGKLFTGNARLMTSRVGSLQSTQFAEIVRVVVAMLEEGLT